jgi:cytochrome c peroxidase
MAFLFKPLVVLGLAAALQGMAAPLPDEPIKPVPLTLHQDPVRAELGRRLFHDARLSANNTVSCASCHSVTSGGADGRARSPGFNG